MLSDEEKKAIEIVEDIAFVRGIRQDVDGELEDLKAIEDVLRLVEKQQKEIEELKENNKLLQENYSSAHEDINWFCENYISKKESEQKEKQAYIDGTNIADKLCNKKWKDKIKAKIEEVDYKMIAHQDVREAVKQVLNSLLEKE
jgi:hypothetical protein